MFSGLITSRTSGNLRRLPASPCPSKEKKKLLIQNIVMQQCEIVKNSYLGRFPPQLILETAIMREEADNRSLKDDEVEG